MLVVGGKSRRNEMLPAYVICMVFYPGNLELRMRGFQACRCTLSWIPGAVQKLGLQSLVECYFTKREQPECLKLWRNVLCYNISTYKNLPQVPEMFWRHCLGKRFPENEIAKNVFSVLVLAW